MPWYSETLTPLSATTGAAANWSCFARSPQSVSRTSTPDSSTKVTSRFVSVLPPSFWETTSAQSSAVLTTARTSMTWPSSACSSAEILTKSYLVPPMPDASAQASIFEDMSKVTS